VTAIFTSESSSEQPEAAGPSKGATAAATAAAVAAATEAATSEIVLEHITHTPKNDTIVSEDAITVTVESSEQGSAAPAPSEPAPSTRAAAPQYVFWTRGKCIAAVFASQGLGNLAASVAMLLILLTMPRDHLDWSWRLALFLGAVPAMFILIPRFRLRESAAFLKAEAADSDGIKAAHVPARSALAVFKTYWSQLLGTAGSWFLLDIVFYGNSLFASTLIDMAGVASHEWEGVLQNVAMNVFIALLALPGYWTAVFLIDLVGRRRLQIGGFVLMATVYITMGLCFDIIKQYPIMFISLYGLSYFFANAGPNSTTFIVRVFFIDDYNDAERASERKSSLLCSFAHSFVHNQGTDRALSSVDSIDMPWIVSGQWKGGRLCWSSNHAPGVGSGRRWNYARAVWHRCYHGHDALCLLCARDA